MPAIEVDNISKRFRKRHRRRGETIALEGINFSVEEGDFIGIAGENGAGKTTLLKLISKILVPSEGEIIVNSEKLLFADITIALQEYLTVAENIFFLGAIWGMDRQEIKSKLREIIEFAELGEFSDTKASHISYGMRTRLVFSVAMTVDADIILLDEILIVGDMRFRQKCYKVLEEFKREKKTVIIATYSLNAVEKLCDKTLVLNKGRQVIFDDTDKVVRVIRETKNIESIYF